MDLGTLFDGAVILLLVLGIGQFVTPPGARRGNLVASLALALAAMAVPWRHPLEHAGIVLAALAIGSAAGWIVAARMTMLQIPAMVAFQHGAGGVAAFLVAWIELMRAEESSPDVGTISGLLGLFVGAATFSGSMIAAAKLAGRMRGAPTRLGGHGWITGGLFAAVCLFAVVAALGPPEALLAATSGIVLLSTAIGVLVALRVGGADMPVLISTLNATAGLAAALCGVVLRSHLLVAFGATVAASGSILTHVMCRAMNRDLLSVLTGFAPAIAAHETPALSVVEAPTPVTPQREAVPAQIASTASDVPAESPADPMERAASALERASRVVIVPGYGMALAGAQGAVAELASRLGQRGAEVRFAIHPVAGRMPGHMNVLLAEADVPYEQLAEMEDVNPTLDEVDVALVVGACDVVNPAAQQAADTPIAGMPIIEVHRARAVVVCNLDEKPGYSGVDNPLYRDPKCTLLLGDAADTVARLLARVAPGPS